jgi:hypothetical protein
MENTDLKHMRITYIIGTAAYVLAFGGCKKENLCDCLKSTGSIVTEKRSVGVFDKLEVRKNVHVTLYQDSVSYVEVEAGSHLVDLVRTDVNDGVLVITNDNTCNWVRSYKIDIRVSVHLLSLSRIDHFGSEEITCGNRLAIDFLDVYEKNSADIHLDVEARHLFVRQMVGGGDIYLTGTAQFNYNFGGSFGYIYAGGLSSDTVLVDQRGTGDVHVSPKSWMKVNIEDRGNVYYTGSPVIVAYLNGSGQLYHE